MGPWHFLLSESLDHIGLLEDEWNHCDMLTEATKLLHNTEISTQPWKTGLPCSTARPDGLRPWSGCGEPRAGSLREARTRPSAISRIPTRARSARSSPC